MERSNNYYQGPIPLFEVFEQFLEEYPDQAPLINPEREQQVRQQLLEHNSRSLVDLLTKRAQEGLSDDETELVATYRDAVWQLDYEIKLHDADNTNTEA